MWLLFMKIIYRSILKELISFFLLGLVIFSFILLLERIIYLIDLSFKQGVPFLITLKLLIYIFPTFAIFTIPVSLLVASVTVFSRLSSDGEIVALKASGFSLYRLLIPGVILSLFVALVNAFFILWGQPWGNQAFKKALFQLVESQANLNLKEGVFNDYPGGLVIYVREIPLGEARLKRVVISDTRDQESSQIIFGEEGVLVSNPGGANPVLALKNGSIHKIFGDKGKYELLNFSSYQLSLGGYNMWDQEEGSKKSSKEMTFKEIREKLNEWVQSKPRDYRESRYYYKVLTEFHRKFSLPYACLVLGLLGIPLGIKNQRSGRSGGFAISIVVLTIYNMLSVTSEGLAEGGGIHPLLALWIPNLILTLVTVYVIYKVGQELPFKGLERLVEWVEEWLDKLIKGLERPLGWGKRWRDKWKKKKGSEPFRGVSQGKNITPPKQGLYSGLLVQPRLKILNRYLAREYGKILFFGLGAFVSIYFLVEFIGRLEDMAQHGTELYYLFLYFVYKLPAIIYQVLPFAILLSSIVTITLLGRNNELTAIKSCGISLYRLSVPLLMLGLLFSFFSFLGNEFLLPYTNHQADQILRVKIKKRIPRGVFKNTKIWYRGEDNTIWHIQLLAPAGKVMRGVTLLKFDEQEWLKERVDADRVEWKDKRFMFLSGYARNFSPDGSMQSHYFSQREVYSTEQIEDFRIVQKTPEQMSFRELYGFVQKLRINGFDATAYTVDMHSKLSLPMACLIMVIVGIPFSLRSSRSGGLPLGIIFSLFLGFAYWLLYFIGISLGHAGRLPPLVAAWSTDILFLAVAIYLILSDRQ